MAEDPDRSRKPRRALRVDVIAGGAGFARAARGLARWLARVAPPGATGEVTVALVSDAQIRALNRRYRQKDHVTDVLSFPGDPPRSLGDVVIAIGRARRQARAAGHTFATELRILALHGLLHLVGFDHERDAGRMARVERRLRLEGGLREGLIERARGGGRRVR